MVITLGKVLELLTDKNKVRVRAPLFETSGDQREVILDCAVCHDPGSLNGYKVDDTVYISFTDNDFTRPFILGKLYLGLENEEGSNFQKAASLEVTDNAKLPVTTTIGDMSFVDISNAAKELINVNNILQNKQNKLVAGTHITLVNNPNDTTTINATGGGGSGSEVTPSTQYVTGASTAHSLNIDGTDYNMPAEIINLEDGTGTNSIQQYTSVANGNNSAALGHNTETSANCTFTAGTHTFAGCHAQTAIGKYNTKYTGGNLLFVVGNGNADNDRSDAFKVWTNGTAEIKAVGTGDNAVVNKKYVDDRCITEISTETIRLWDLEPGIYKLTYNGEKKFDRGIETGLSDIINAGNSQTFLLFVNKLIRSNNAVRKSFKFSRADWTKVAIIYGEEGQQYCSYITELNDGSPIEYVNWTLTSNIFAPTAAGVAGQVCTWPSSGNTPTWTTLTHSYRHDIMLYDNAAYFCCFSFINNNPTQYTTSAAISAALVSLGFIYANGKFLGATGPHANSTYRAVAGAEGSNVWYLKGDNAWANGDWGSISDIVTQIC